MNKDLLEKLSKEIKGEIVQDDVSLEKYSRDTSIFKVRPSTVVFPKDKEDIMSLVSFVSEHKKDHKDLSITVRAAGSDMSGGPLNESIIADVTKYINKIEKIDQENLEAVVEPGVFYRDFEKETLPKGIVLPPYPASKDLAAIGGMIANNGAGEKTLRYGKMARFVKELEVVLADGNTYSFSKISKNELEEKKKQDNFEGEVYRKLHTLLEDNYDLVQSARPDVSKNSAGYALWDIWDRENFDMTQLFTGSQGTLGIITNSRLKLVKDKPYKKLAVLFFKSWDNLPRIVNKILPLDPEEMEAFDQETLELGIRFMPKIAKRVGRNVLSFMFSFLPEAWISVKMFEIPDLVLLVQFAEDSLKEVEAKAEKLKKELEGEKVYLRIMEKEEDAAKYWIVRRESFALLRGTVGDKQTAPFVDDIIVKPEYLTEFLPKVLKVLDNHNIQVTLAGHAGNGNFHIIPLMDLSLPEEKAKILSVSDQIYDLVVEYKGSITAEHNDGIIRTPYLEQMYGSEVYNLFKKVKDIFDPKNIFNPGKKVGGSKKYLEDHIAGK